jgi:CheY-like chemotaxis protein
MTANAFEEDKQAALHAGMNGHLAKPVNEDALIKALTEVIRDDSRDLSQPTEEQIEKNIWT